MTLKAINTLAESIRMHPDQETLKGMILDSRLRRM